MHMQVHVRVNHQRGHLCVCHRSAALQVCILTPDGSHGVRRLPNAAEAGLCSACLDVHSNSILAGERSLPAVHTHACLFDPCLATIQRHGAEQLLKSAQAALQCSWPCTRTLCFTIW